MSRPHYPTARDTYAVINDQNKVIEKFRLKGTANQRKRELESQGGGPHRIVLTKDLGDIKNGKM